MRFFLRGILIVLFFFLYFFFDWDFCSDLGFSYCFNNIRKFDSLRLFLLDLRGFYLVIENSPR